MIKLPWTNKTCPNFVLEINRQCDIRCEGCYKRLDGSNKPLEEIKNDLDTALTLRNIQTVSIAGGEPLLHPELSEIIRLVRGRKLKTALSTNGYSLSDQKLGALASAGLDIIMLHIDEGQIRDDLPHNPSIKEIAALRDRLTMKVVKSGLDVGLSVTVYPGYLDRVTPLVEYVLRSKHIHVLFATNYVDVDDAKGMSAFLKGDTSRDNVYPNKMILAMMKDCFGMSPFAFMGDGIHKRESGKAPLWLLYFFPVANNNGEYRIVHLRHSWLNNFLVRMPRLLYGKDTFYMKQNSSMNRGIVILNAIANVGTREGLKNLWQAWKTDSHLYVKRFVFENGPVMNERGILTCMPVCVNATVRNGVLTPPCLEKTSLA